MASRFITSVNNGLVKLNHKWIKDNLQYEVITGSVAYGMSQDDSDEDIYGWCIPPKEMLFPHLAGHISGFGPKPQGFESFQQHHVKDGEKEYDFTIYSIVKFFDLVLQNNPNMIDTLFVPLNCITHMTSIGQILYEKRHSFLHKGAYHKFKGYAYAQIHKMKTKEFANSTSTKRKDSIEQHGFDVKFASHVVRLLGECSQILIWGDIDLQRDKDTLKAIRRGEWTQEQVIDYFKSNEKYLEELYQKSHLPHSPDMENARTILMHVIEEHYGSISEAVRIDRTDMLLSELKGVLSKYE